MNIYKNEIPNKDFCIARWATCSSYRFQYIDIKIYIIIDNSMKLFRNSPGHGHTS